MARPGRMGACVDYVSCLPATLYRDGGFQDAPELRLQLDSPGPHGAGLRQVAELYPPYRYVRPLPRAMLGAEPAFADALRVAQHVQNKDLRHGAACVLAWLEHGFAHGNVLYSRVGCSARVIYETFRANDRPYVPLVDPFGAGHPHEPMSDTTVLDLFIGSAGSFNYGHWLVDDLPRAAAVAALRRGAGERTIRIWLTDASPAMDRVREESLRRMCEGVGPLEVRFLRLDRVYDFAHLHYATPVSYHPVLKSPDALAWLATPFTGQAGGRKLYVTRRAERGRGLLNEADVQARLLPLGFEPVDPEGMSFAEQAQTFAGATAVVGCMGAGMANCVFARPGARLLYLAPHGWPEPFYWDLAAVRGHEYSVCFGAVADPVAPPHLSPFTISMADLDVAVAQLLR